MPLAATIAELAWVAGGALLTFLICAALAFWVFQEQREASRAEREPASPAFKGHQRTTRREGPPSPPPANQS